MIFYNTVDKRYTDLAFSELTLYGAYTFIAGAYIDMYIEIELQSGDSIIFDYIFKNFDIEKFNEILKKLEIYKL